MPLNDKRTLSCIEIDPSGQTKRSIIWLHGLGADGSDFVPIVPELMLPETLGVRFVFPHAPVMPITINQGFKMRGWFDIYGFSIDSKVDETGIQQSAQWVGELIQHEEDRGIPSNQILLAGFSQGAVMATIAGLTYSKPLAGIIALSGCLPLADEIIKQGNTVNKTIPIFIAHGTEDATVPYALGKAAYSVLHQAHYPVTWHSYPMAHSICAEELQDMHQWLMNVFNPERHSVSG